MALNAPPDARHAGPPPGRRLLDNLWFAASSPQMTIALAVLLAFTFGLAASVPQLPTGLDPVASELWVSTTATRLGSFGPFLSSAGLFALLGGPWATSLLAVAALHLILRIARQASRLIRGRTPDMPLAPPGLPFELVVSHTALSAMQSVFGVVLGDDGPRGSTSRWRKFTTWVSAPRTIVRHDLEAPRPRTDAFSERRAWAAIGPLLTYAGLLLIIGGILWNSLYGWRASDIAMTTEGPVQPVQARDLAMTLIEAGGAGEERPAVLGLSRGAASSYFWLGYDRPVSWGGAWVVQRASGPALSIRAQAENRALTLQSLESGGESRETLHLRFGQNESEQGFSIPSRDLAFRVVSYENLPDPAITGPVFLIEGYARGNTTPQLSELVSESGAVDWEGMTLTLQRDRYVVVDLAAVPGWPALLPGGLILLVGASLTAWVGTKRIWINAATDRGGTLTAVRVAAPAAGQDQVTQTAAALAHRTAQVSPEGSEDNPTQRPWGKLLALATAAVMVAGAALLAAYSAQAAPISIPEPRVWAFNLRNALAGAGLAVWIPALVASALWAVRSGAPGEAMPRTAGHAVDPQLPPDVHPQGAFGSGMRGRTGDPGRALALAGFPLLTAALLASGAWDYLAFAALWRAVASEMWLLAAWCTGAAYLHATSGWRPLRVPAWLAVTLAAATLVAGLACALTSGTLLV
jgi:hypothetical protein